MKVIIPVAGKGRRLTPHSYSTAKTLMPLARKKVIDYLLEPILKLSPQEVIIIYDHFNYTPVKEYLEKTYPTTIFKFAIQEEPLGTAHAIYCAKEFIEHGDEIFIAYSDMVFEKNLDIIYKKNLCDGLIFYFKVDDPQNYGVLVHNNFILQKIIEKPTNPVSKLVNAGIYYLKDGYNFINYYLKQVIESGKNRSGEYYITDAFCTMANDNKKIMLEHIEQIHDCGTVAKLLKTNSVFLNGDSVTGIGVELLDTTLGKNVVIGENSFLKNCNVENSIIGSNVRLIDLELEHSVIGDNVVINKNGKRYNVGSNATIL
jgi:glucose-1-phosphate thymidylyltransferase